MRSAIISGAIALAFAGPAHADWEYTKWGMTVDQAIKASGGKAKAYSAAESASKSTFIGQKCLAGYNGHVVAGHSFEVRFCFDQAQKLTSVSLYAPREDFYSIDRDLRSAFGSPVMDSGGSIPSVIWNDTAKGNSLKLTLVSSAILEYTPKRVGF